MHAQTIEAADWWARPRGQTNAAWIANYQKSLTSRHRDRIVEIVREIQPKTLLEVGCHCGPNLVRLGQEFPALRMIGIDANADAITAGRAWVQGTGLESRIQLNAARFPEATDTVADQAFDVVLSCYACAYIAPPDLDATLYEFGRLARRAVILAEPMAEQAQWNGGLTGYSEWAHNYQRATRWLNTWTRMTRRIVGVDPPVDRLSQILVAVRDEPKDGNVQLPARRNARRG